MIPIIYHRNVEFFFGRKRKVEVKAKPPPSKKIKREPGVLCSICNERFEKVALRDSHLAKAHRPLISDYGCSTCHEQFLTLEANASHNEWHWKFNVFHTCAICSASFQNVMIFQNHVASCVHPSYSSMRSIVKSIFCNLCSCNYETQNLYVLFLKYSMHYAIGQLLVIIILPYLFRLLQVQLAQLLHSG